MFPVLFAKLFSPVHHIFFSKVVYFVLQSFLFSSFLRFPALLLYHIHDVVILIVRIGDDVYISVYPFVVLHSGQGLKNIGSAGALLPGR